MTAIAFEYVGGPRDGDRTFSPPVVEQARNGSRGGQPAFATYVRHRGRVVFLGWLPYGNPAIRDACKQAGISPTIVQ